MTVRYVIDQRSIDNNVVETSWIEYAESGDYQLIVMNRGAHYMPNMIVNDNLRLLIPFFSRIMTKFPQTQIFFRNSVSGHPFCGDFDKPFEVADNYNQIVDNLYLNYNEIYHWERLADQNGFMTTAFESIKAITLDVNASTFFRPDSHANPNRDCLHYCVPGPVDNWVILFYNTLVKYSSFHSKSSHTASDAKDWEL